jgi:hypothetical protein
MAQAVEVREIRSAAAPATNHAAEQAFRILRFGFTLAPIVFGLDKFFNVTVEWPRYLAPWLDRLVPGTAQEFMYAVGIVEILAGVVVGIAPRFGGWLVAGWLGGVIVNLLSVAPPRYYDIALRDLGLLLAAVALARLATSAHARRTRR